MEMPGKRWTFLIFLLSLALLLAFALALSWGRYPEPGFIGFREWRQDDLARALIFRLRLPRALMALCTGAVLAAAGMVLQTVLGNPLVEPGLLGVSQGAAFGAGLAILLAGSSAWSVSLSAGTFGLAGLGLSWLLARRIRYGGSILRLILAGIVVSALFSSGLGVLKYLADPRSELPEMTFWLMGGLSSVGWTALVRVLPISGFVLVLLTSLRWRINLLSLDDRSAFALGSRPGRERTILVILAVLAVAAVTAEAGIISWVGLLIPHASRKITGSDTARSFLVAILLGAIFVLLSDTAARSLLTGEIPLGLITSLAGALLFSVLMTLKEVES